jgi:hypothetical protein
MPMAANVTGLNTLGRLVIWLFALHDTAFVYTLGLGDSKIFFGRFGQNRPTVGTSAV